MPPLLIISLFFSTKVHLIGGASTSDSFSSSYSYIRMNLVTKGPLRRARGARSRGFDGLLIVTPGAWVPYS